MLSCLYGFTQFMLNAHNLATVQHTTHDKTFLTNLTFATPATVSSIKQLHVVVQSGMQAPDLLSILAWVQPSSLAGLAAWRSS